MGSTRCQAGVNQGSNRGQPGVNLGSTWGQPGVNLGSTWGQPGVNMHRPTFRSAACLPDPIHCANASPVTRRTVSSSFRSFILAGPIWRQMLRVIFHLNRCSSCSRVTPPECSGES